MDRGGSVIVSKLASIWEGANRPMMHHNCMIPRPENPSVEESPILAKINFFINHVIDLPAGRNAIIGTIVPVPAGEIKASLKMS